MLFLAPQKISQLAIAYWYQILQDRLYFIQTHIACCEALLQVSPYLPVCQSVYTYGPVLLSVGVLHQANNKSSLTSCDFLPKPEVNSICVSNVGKEDVWMEISEPYLVLTGASSTADGAVSLTGQVWMPLTHVLIKQSWEILLKLRSSMRLWNLHTSDMTQDLHIRLLQF